MVSCAAAARRPLCGQRAEERPVRQPRELVVVRPVLDLVHLAADALRDAAQDGHECEEEQQQRASKMPATGRNAALAACAIGA